MSIPTVVHSGTSASGASPDEAIWLTDQLRSSRLTVLSGDTAEAMSELLMSGVMPRLQRRATDRQPPPPPNHDAEPLPFADRREKRDEVNEVVVFFDHWGESPRHVLVEKLLDAVGERGRRAAAGDGLPVRLGDKLATLSRHFGLRFLIILDGFDACLGAPPQRPDLRALCDELLAAINQPDLAAQFLIALREDGEGLLEQLRKRIEGFDAVRKPLAGPPAPVHQPVAPPLLAEPVPPVAVAPSTTQGTQAVYSLIESWLGRSSQHAADTAPKSSAAPWQPTPTVDEPEPFALPEEASAAAVELPSFPSRPRKRAERASAPLKEPMTSRVPQVPQAAAPSEPVPVTAPAVAALEARREEPGEFTQVDVFVPLETIAAVEAAEAAEEGLSAEAGQAVDALVPSVPVEVHAVAESPPDGPEAEAATAFEPTETDPTVEDAASLEAADEGLATAPEVDPFPVTAAEPVESATAAAATPEVPLPSEEAIAHAQAFSSPPRERPLERDEPSIEAVPWPSAALPDEPPVDHWLADEWTPFATPLDEPTRGAAEEPPPVVGRPIEDESMDVVATTSAKPGIEDDAVAPTSAMPVIVLRDPPIEAASPADVPARREPHPFNDNDAESSLFVDTLPDPYFAEVPHYPEIERAPLDVDFPAPERATEPPRVEGIDLGREPLPPKAKLRMGGLMLPPVPSETARRPGKKTPPPWRSMAAFFGAVLLIGAIASGLWWWPEHDTPLAGPSGERGRFATLDPTLPPVPASLRGRISLSAGDALSSRVGDDLARAFASAGGPSIAVQGSRGWYEDLASLRDGSRLAIARYDALQALRADGGGAGSLRIVMPLFSEELAFVVRADSPLRWIHQVEGKRINIGPGAGARALTVRTAYSRLFNKPLPTERSSLAGEAAALEELLGRSVDVVVLVGNAPAPWAGAWPEMAGGLRLLALEPNHASTKRALGSMLTARLDAGPDAGPDAPPTQTLAMMAFLVAGDGTTATAGTASARPGSDGAPVDLARVASALCRQLPALQKDGHPKWREVRPELQPDAGWPYAPEAQGALRDCPSASIDPAAAQPTPQRMPATARSSRTASLRQGLLGRS